jgi:anti-anti-sigma factor
MQSETTSTSPSVDLTLVDLQIRNDSGQSHIAVNGELDASSARLLDETVEWLRRDGHRQITLDLDALTFLDCSVLGVLVRSHQALRAAGGQLTLIRPTEAATRLFRLTGLDRELDIRTAAVRRSPALVR